MSRAAAFLAGVWVSGTAFAAPMSLTTAVDRTLARSPMAAQAEAGVQEAQAGLAVARLSRWPKLTARSAVLRGDDPVFAFSSLLQQRSFAAQNFAVDALNNPGYRTDFKNSIEMGIPLFTGFELSEREELGRLGAASAGDAAEGSAQTDRYRAVEAYLRIMLSAAQVDNAKERIASARAELADAQRLKARGLVLGSDYYAAQAVLAGLAAEKTRAAGELAAARAALSVLTGSATGQIETLGALEDVRYDLPPLELLLEQALAERRDLRRAALGEKSAAVLRDRESRSLLPRVDAFASLETNDSAAARLLGVRAELPFGDATYPQRKAKAAAALRGAREGRRALEQGARLEVLDRYEALAAVLEALPSLQESVENAGKSLELFRPLYREGRQSILEVLRAEEALARSRAGYLEGQFRAQAGYAGLMLAAGGLDGRAVAEMERRLGGRK